MTQAEWLNFALAVAIGFGLPAIAGNALIAFLRWRGLNNAADWVTTKAPAVLAFLAKNKPKQAAIDKGLAYLATSHRPEARIAGVLIESHLPPENTAEKVDPPAPPSPKPPPLPPLPVLLCLLVGCASPFHFAAAVNNVAADTLNEVGPKIRAKCVDGMARASTPEQIAELDKFCEPATLTYEATVTAQHALSAALFAFVGGDESKLAPALDRVVKLGAELLEVMK